MKENTMGISKFIKKMFRMRESSFTDLYGTPLSPETIQGYIGNIPTISSALFGRELYPDRSVTLRTPQQFDLIRNYCRLMAETNPNASAIVLGLKNYVIGAGLSTKIEPKGNGVNRLIKQCQEIIDDFCSHNKFDDWADESLSRYIIDGECFFRLFPQQKTTELRCIEPDSIRCPTELDNAGDWSFGCHNAPNDVGIIDAYNIQSRIGEDEQVQSHFIHHIKANVNRRTKRGISFLYASLDELKGVDMLREATLLGERVRNSIAYIRQFQTAPQSVVQVMNETNRTGTLPAWKDNNVSTDRSFKQIFPGEVVDIPKGLEFKSPPESPNTKTSSEIMRDSLNSVAARLQVPTWVVEGSVESSSYASSITAESPFYHTCIRLQRIITEYWKDILTDIIEIEMSKGNLPEDTLDKIKISVIAPSPMGRGSKEQVESQLLLVEEKVLSRHTLATMNGIDLSSELDKIKEEDEEPLFQKETIVDETGTEPKTMNGKLQKDEKNM